MKFNANYNGRVTMSVTASTTMPFVTMMEVTAVRQKVLNTVLHVSGKNAYAMKVG